MGAFELNSSTPRNETRNDTRNEIHNAESLNSRKLREECIIALKVYDSCRQQDCLTESQLGPARAAECYDMGCGERIHEGDIINPPDGAASVTIDFVKVKKIIIVDKRPNPFKNGFWDIDLKYVFEYRLTFRAANGDIILRVRANSIYNKRMTLFGSIGSDLAFSTDLFRTPEENTIDSEPFIMVEAKAVALSAEMRYNVPCFNGSVTPEPLRPGSGGRPPVTPLPPMGQLPSGDYNMVFVTIGLFTIIKLFRIVTLNVESNGFNLSDECD